MFEKPEDMPYKVPLHLNNMAQKGGASVGYFQEKTGFYIIVLQNDTQIFGLLTLNHCMILQVSIVCISFVSV